MRTPAEIVKLLGIVVADDATSWDCGWICGYEVARMDAEVDRQANDVAKANAAREQSKAAP